MALTHGTFCFMSFKGYGWYLSSTAALLYLSYILHNLVSWMKIKPFFHGKSTIFKPRFVKWTTRIYLSTLALTVPPILFQIADNFRYFNGYSGWYVQIRPYEPLMRDPWWVFCCGILFYVISKSYGMGVMKIVKKSPRFGILFISIILALIFTCLDIVVSIHNFIGETDGINPFWKLSLVFKCLTDAILLDDFKTELKRLGIKRMKRDEKRRESFALTIDDDFAQDSDEEAAMHFSNGNTDHRMTNGHAYRASVSTPTKRKGENQEQSEQVEFMEALHQHDSRLSSDRESRRDSAQRPRIGQGGLPAAKLPRLFAAIKPGKKSKAQQDDDVARNDSNTDSLWSQKEENKTPDRNGKRREKDSDDIGPDEVIYEDDALEDARREQARTIAELTQRQNKAVESGNVDRSVQKRRAASRDFWHDLSDIDDDDDSGPSSSSRH